ncbi:replicative DNA helicase [Massilia sp. W12]|uniref:replicative DNA helicase n=1 Tax=Massilia sp. W12 TaxID=3126507 RepID=UPI0030D15CF6
MNQTTIISASRAAVYEVTAQQDLLCAEHAEQAILGALLSDSQAYASIGHVPSSAFCFYEHRLVFAAMGKLADQNAPIDVISVAEFLKTHGKLTTVGGLPYLQALYNASPGSANLQWHIALLKERALRRNMVRLSDKIQRNAQTSPQDAFVQIGQVAEEILRLQEEKAASRSIKASEAMSRHIALLEQRFAGVSNAISTGIAQLDQHLSGGMRLGELLVLAARPKMGKTALAMQIAAHVAQSQPVYFMSLEMPLSQLQDRMLASLGRIPLHHLLQVSDTQKADWCGVTRALQKIEGLALHWDDQAGLSLQDVKASARLEKQRHGLSLLVIDYLQLLSAAGETRNAQIETLTRGLKALAKELDCAILLLSQLNRSLEQRLNKRPIPADLRDSGAIEQDADAVLFLYRDEVYHPDTAPPGLCEIELALCRQGKPGRMYMHYIGEELRFADVGPDFTPPEQADFAAHAGSGRIGKRGILRER